jgi:alpha-glucosidase (family GH31 glycosyl hydrolase)
MTASLCVAFHRATFPGAGRFTGHWTGDNAGNWENLWFSIAGEAGVLGVHADSA